MIKVEKLDGSIMPFDENRIIAAVNKSAIRTEHPVTTAQMTEVLNEVHNLVHMADINDTVLTVDDLHATVARALSKVRFDVASEYSQFRRHKREQNQHIEILEKQMALALSEDTKTGHIDMHQLTHAKAAIDKLIAKHPTEHAYSILYRYMGDIEQNADKEMWKFIANTVVMTILTGHIVKKLTKK